jgi:hypothetical protein
MLAFRRREISPFPSLLELDKKEGDLLTNLVDENNAHPLRSSPVPSKRLNAEVLCALDFSSDY